MRQRRTLTKPAYSGKLDERSPSASTAQGDEHYDRLRREIREMAVGETLDVDVIRESLLRLGLIEVSYANSSKEYLDLVSCLQSLALGRSKADGRVKPKAKPKENGVETARGNVLKLKGAAGHM